MITWNSKVFLAGATCVALAGCDELAGFGGAQNNGLPYASLAGGSVNLVPPVGYCVDKRSVRARFAVMARCDTLGGDASFGAPLAVITAATVDQGAGTSASSGSETVLSRRTSGTLTLLQVSGSPPSPEMRDVYWRAVGPVGNQVIGLAIYEGENGEPLGESAPSLLTETMQRTRARTAAVASAAKDNSATTLVKPE
ncbi:hypothetical protein [Tateyamaria sp.]|uniref:hypothetical protein n=1 Tax=Tateyamaria sp. TaxID=1929288 RepID=UPI0032A10798